MTSSATSVTDTHDASCTAAGSVNQAISSVHGVIARAADAVGPALDAITQGAHHTVDSLGDSAQRAAGRIDATRRQYRNAGVHFGETCTARVRAKPIAALGIAAAAGFAIAFLLRLR